jgi:hypothetical protein
MKTRTKNKKIVFSKITEKIWTDTKLLYSSVYRLSYEDTILRPVWTRTKYHQRPLHSGIRSAKTLVLSGKTLRRKRKRWVARVRWSTTRAILLTRPPGLTLTRFNLLSAPWSRNGTPYMPSWRAKRDLGQTFLRIIWKREIKRRAADLVGRWFSCSISWRHDV